MRRRGLAEPHSPTVGDFVKNLDAFPKVPATYLETSRSGGTITLLCFCVVLYLTVSEIDYFLNTSKRFVFKYSPDVDFKQKLDINVDITIKMLCEDLGADILDITRSPVQKFGKFSYEPVSWEMDEKESLQFQVKKMTSSLGDNYYSIVNFIWNAGFISMFNQSPRSNPGHGDACRIWGKMVLNKLMGNLHIIVGKDMGIANMHVHLPIIFGSANFSHRINHFSFGEPVPGIINPLEGDIKLAETERDAFTYYISVIPTSIKIAGKEANAFQYSVTEIHKIINHEKGEHGIPGIFFIYDTSALKVTVSDKSQSLGDFIIRLCGIVGGTYATSGLLYILLSVILHLATCGRVKSQLLNPPRESDPLPPQQAANPIQVEGCETDGGKMLTPI